VAQGQLDLEDGRTQVNQFWAAAVLRLSFGGIGAFRFTAGL